MIKRCLKNDENNIHPGAFLFKESLLSFVFYMVTHMNRILTNITKHMRRYLNQCVTALVESAYTRDTKVSQGMHDTSTQRYHGPKIGCEQN